MSMCDFSQHSHSEHHQQQSTHHFLLLFFCDMMMYEHPTAKNEKKQLFIFAEKGDKIRTK